MLEMARVGQTQSTMHIYLHFPTMYGI